MTEQMRVAPAQAAGRRSEPSGSVPDRCARNRAAHAEAGQQLSDDLNVPAAPTGIPNDVEEHIKLMFDLQVLAWQAEITRVTTFMLAKELSTAVYPKSNVRDAFHTLSHHSNIQENKDRFAVLNRYHVKAVRLPPRQAAEDAGRRRDTARSLDGAVRQRHERRQPAQSHRPADHPCRRRIGTAEGRPSPPPPEEHADGQSARGHAPQAGHARQSSSATAREKCFSKRH